VKISNKLQLPEPIVKAIQANWYAGGGEQRFDSVTELLKPAKQFLLTRRHNRELERDASDMIWTLMGSAMHRVVEAAQMDNSLREERLAADFAGERITGGFDLYHDGVVSDFKFTNVWNHIHGSRVRDWTAQLNLYAWLLEKHGFKVKGVEVICIFRDWSKAKSSVDPFYPKPVERVVLELWTPKRTEAFLAARLSQIKMHESLPDDMIPPCSPEERWEAPAKYAVMKPGAKRALRVFDNKGEAENYAGEHADKPEVITREARPIRCWDYCEVNRFCHFYRELMAGEGEHEQEEQAAVGY